jgi:hypothetical protein
MPWQYSINNSNNNEIMCNVCNMWQCVVIINVIICNMCENNGMCVMCNIVIYNERK